MSEYTPAEAEMRNAVRPHYTGPEFDRFIAQVRTDAAREALDGLLAQYDRAIERAERLEDSRHALRIAAYRDTHYPQGGTDGR